MLDTLRALLFQSSVRGVELEIIEEKTTVNVSVEKTMSENRNLSPDYAAAETILEKLEREGVLAKNGEYRPGEGGILEPVYVPVEYAKQPGTGGGSDDLCDNRS